MAFGSDLDDHDDVMSEINMTPLVDVMLVLLIIFIITVPVLTHTINVDLPQTASPPSDIKPDTIIITVKTDTTLYWNEDAVTQDELEQRLTVAASQSPQPDLQLRGDKQVAYEHVIQVMAAVQRAGLEQLGFVTEAADPVQ